MLIPALIFALVPVFSAALAIKYNDDYKLPKAADACLKTCMISFWISVTVFSIHYIVDGIDWSFPATTGSGLLMGALLFMRSKRDHSKSRRYYETYSFSSTSTTVFLSSIALFFVGFCITLSYAMNS